jgi:hypothetical protein
MQVCSAASVITFQDSNVLSSLNRTNIAMSFQDGWMRLAFPQSSAPGTVINTNHQLTSSAAAYFGLPTIGFAVASYTNGFVPNGCAPGTCVLSNYGGNWIHKYTDNIQTQ